MPKFYPLPVYNHYMPLFRGLFLLFAVWLAIAVVRRLYATRSQRSKRTATTAPRVKYTTMVPCHGCGVHIPKAETIAQGGRYFCGRTCQSGSAGDA